MHTDIKEAFSQRFEDDNQLGMAALPGDHDHSINHDEIDLEGLDGRHLARSEKVAQSNAVQAAIRNFNTLSQNNQNANSDDESSSNTSFESSRLRNNSLGVPNVNSNISALSHVQTINNRSVSSKKKITEILKQQLDK